jgi:predicted permease
VLQSLGRHLRDATRLLLRTPAFAAIAVLSLAVGIGANTTIFTAANAIALAPTPGLAHQDGLVDIGRSHDGRGFDTVSYLTYADLRDQTDVFSGVYAIELEPKALSLDTADGAERVYAEEVSASYFDVLGLVPARGAFFRTTEEQVGTPLRKVVLSHAFWTRRFQADPALVGRTLVLNGEPFAVTAIAPEHFQGTTVVTMDIWVPLTAHVRGLPSVSMLRERLNNSFIMGARLRPGVSLRQAQQSVDAFMTRLRAQHPEPYRAAGLVLAPSSRVPGEAGQFAGAFLSVLMGLVGLVLLVACTNLAGLLLARAAGRSREIAIRLAIGASRASLIGMLLTESLLVFVLGAGAGMILAHWMTAVLASALTSVPVPLSLDLHLDWRVLAFTSALTLVTGLVTGLAPAWQSTKADVTTDLKSDANAPRRQRLRHVFTAAQIAFGLVLMIMAGLLLRALSTATRVDSGFQIDAVDVASTELALGGYADDRASSVSDELTTRFTAIPGVQSVGTAAMVALDGGGMGLGALRRRGAPGPEGNIETDWNIISTTYLPTLGIPVSRGRNFDTTDRAGAGRVAIINEYLARHVFPGQDPVGQVLENGDFRSGRENTIEPITIVGVARDAKYRWLGETPRDFIYVPLAQTPTRRLNFFIRRSPALAASVDLQTPVREALKAFDRNLPLVQMTPFRQYADTGLLPQRIAASLAGSLGGVALLLAAIGIYGVTAFSVASRTREIGVRMALGADRARVRRMVIGQAMRITAIGGGIGVLIAGVLSRLLADLLFGVSPLDPLSFGVTIAALVAVVMAASLVPAQRAASIQPVVALKNE